MRRVALILAIVGLAAVYGSRAEAAPTPGVITSREWLAAAFAAPSKPRPVAFRWASGRSDLEANTGSLSFEYLDASLCSVRYFTMSLESGTRRTAARVFGGAYSQPCPLLADVQLACVEVDVGPLQPEQLAEHVRGHVERGACIVGGCCGSTPAHVAVVARALGR